MSSNRMSSNTMPSNKATFNKKANATLSFSMRRVGLVLGVSALVAAPGFALAGSTNSDVASYQLSYNAAELKSAESVKALHTKIRRIALDYCPDYSVTRNLSERASCINDVESDLVSQVNHPLLTRIHSGDAAVSIASTAR